MNLWEALVSTLCLLLTEWPREEGEVAGLWCQQTNKQTQLRAKCSGVCPLRQKKSRGLQFASIIERTILLIYALMFQGLILTSITFIHECLKLLDRVELNSTLSFRSPVTFRWLSNILELAPLSIRTRLTTDRSKKYSRISRQIPRE